MQARRICIRVGVVVLLESAMAPTLRQGVVAKRRTACGGAARRRFTANHVVAVVSYRSTFVMQQRLLHGVQRVRAVPLAILTCGAARPTSACDGARGRSRTDTLLRAADFRTTSTFVAPAHRLRGFVVWSTPSPWPHGCRCPPSALYTFPRVAWAWFGVSSSGKRTGPSPSLTGFTSQISPRGLKWIRLSPLRLPIPPLGLRVSTPPTGGGRYEYRAPPGALKRTYALPGRRVCDLLLSWRI